MEQVWIDSFDVNLKFALRNLKSAILLSAMLFALCFSAEAQQAKKVYRIGYLSPRLGIDSRGEAFRKVCATLDTSKDRTSSSNGDLLKATRGFFGSLRPS